MRKKRGQKEISLECRQALASAIREAIDALSKRRGKISYAELAERSGDLITEGAITHLLAGRIANPSVLTILGLARALEIDPVELFNAALGLQRPAEYSQSIFFELYENFSRLERDLQRKMVMDHVQDLLEIMKPLPKRPRTEHTVKRPKKIGS